MNKTIVSILPNWKLRVMDVKAFASDETHFFDRKTLKFFSGKVHAPAYKVVFDDGSQGVVFVTTERCGFEDNSRKATLRIIAEYNGRVQKLGTFLEFDDVATARSAFKAQVKNGSIPKVEA